MIGLADAPVDHLYAAAGDLAHPDPAGVVMRLENKIRGLEHARDSTAETLTRVRKESAAAQSRIGRAFDQEERLAALRRRQAEIEAALIPAESEVGRPRSPGRPAAATPGRPSPSPVGERGSRSGAPFSPNGLPPSPVRGFPWSPHRVSIFLAPDSGGRERATLRAQYQGESARDVGLGDDSSGRLDGASETDGEPARLDSRRPERRD
jgi:hypothetical protein